MVDEKKVAVTMLNTRNALGDPCIWEMSLSKAITEVERGTGTCHVPIEDLKRAYQKDLFGDSDLDHLEDLPISKKVTLTIKLSRMIVSEVIHKSIAFCIKNWVVMGPTIIAVLSGCYFWLRKSRYLP